HREHGCETITAHRVSPLTQSRKTMRGHTFPVPTGSFILVFLGLAAFVAPIAVHMAGERWWAGGFLHFSRRCSVRIALVQVDYLWASRNPISTRGKNLRFPLLELLAELRQGHGRLLMGSEIFAMKLL